jgi:hypothetical protein
MTIEGEPHGCAPLFGGPHDGRWYRAVPRRPRYLHVTEAVPDGSGPLAVRCNVYARYDYPGTRDDLPVAVYVWLRASPGECDAPRDDCIARDGLLDRPAATTP